MTTGVSLQQAIVPVLTSDLSSDSTVTAPSPSVSFSYSSDAAAAVESFIPVLDAAFLTLVNDPAALADTIRTTGLLDMAMVLQILQDMANEIKKAERDGRWADAQGAFDSTMKQATEIREAAEKSFIGDLCSAVITAAVGVVGIGFGVAAYKQASKAATAGAKAQEAEGEMADLDTKMKQLNKNKEIPGADHPEIDRQIDKVAESMKTAKLQHGEAMNTQKVANDNSQASSMMTNAMSITGQATGGIPKAVQDHAAAGDTAQKTEAEAEQQLYDFARDAGTDLMQAIQHLYDKALEVLSAIEDARNQAFSQIATAA